MKRLVLSTGAGLALLCSAHSGYAQAPTPFFTGITNFLYVGKPGMNASTATTAIHPTYNPSVAGGGFTAAGTSLSVSNHVNGVGLNHLDGFIYGVEFLQAGPFSSDARFWRIGANGQTRQIGVITGPTSTDAGRSVVLSFVNTTAGVVDANGDYWFTAYTSASLIPSVSNFDFFVGKIPNVASLTNGNTSNVTPTYYKIDISNSRIQTGFQEFLEQVITLYFNGGFSAITEADGGAEDIAIRPTDNSFYTYVQFPLNYTPSQGSQANLEHYPVRVNMGVTPWRLEPIGTTSNTTPNREIVGTYFDLLSNMYVLFSDGQYSPVNLINGTLSNLQQSALPLINGNLRGDLASNITCATVPLNFKFMSFAGRIENGTTMLSWQTGADKNVVKYLVERCDDGLSFHTVAEQRATGGGIYTATDVMPGSSATYRIQAVGANGEAAFSNIVKLARPTERGSVTTAWPTLLTSDWLRVQTDRSSAIVQIVGMNGQVVRTELIGGARAETITLPGIAPGTYILTVRDAGTGEMLLNERITKQ